jgi:hypothetical protein
LVARRSRREGSFSSNVATWPRLGRSEDQRRLAAVSNDVEQAMDRADT